MAKHPDSDQSKLHGGTRQGAGRKALYSEPTTTIPVPESKVIDIKDWLNGKDTGYGLFTSSDLRLTLAQCFLAYGNLRRKRNDTKIRIIE